MRKSTFSTVLLAGITAAFLISSQTAFAGPDLVGWWEFEEGIGSIAYDSAGDNNGTIYGAAWTTGQIDGALSFDGENDYVNFGDVDEFEFGDNDFSISAWIYAKGEHGGPAGFGMIISKYNWEVQGYTGRQWQLHQNYTGRIIFYTNPTGTPDTHESLVSVTEGHQGRWVHVVAARNGSTKLIYIDGELDATGSTAGVVTGKSSEVYMGASYTPDQGMVNCFNGSIDDVRIYNRALSAGKVYELYEGCKASPLNPPDGATGVDPNVVLSWSAGLWASDVNGHDVYLGTDYNDVNDADTTVFDPNNVYMDRYDTSSFDPCGLDIETTYYWRVDEVNEPNLWKGDVWSFTTVKPYIGLSSTTFDFLHLGTNPDDQILTILNDGIGTLNWQIAYDCDWLTVDPCSGSSTGQDNVVILSIDTSGLDKGTYECELLVVDPCAENSPQTVYVNLYSLCPGDVTGTVTGRIVCPPPIFCPSFDIYLWEGPNGTFDLTDLQALHYLFEDEGGPVSPVPAAALAGDVTGTVTGRTVSPPPPPFIISFDISLWEGPDGTFDLADLQALQYLLEDTSGPYTCP